MSDDYSSLETRIMNEFTLEPLSPDQQREYGELGRVMADHLRRQILSRQSSQIFSQLRDEVSQAVGLPNLPASERVQTSQVAPAQNYPDTVSRIPGLMQTFQRGLDSERGLPVSAGIVDYSRVRPYGPPIRNTTATQVVSTEEAHLNQEAMADIFQQSEGFINSRIDSGTSSNFPTVGIYNRYAARYDDRVDVMSAGTVYLSARSPGKSTTLAHLREGARKLESVGPSGFEDWAYPLPDSQVTLDAAIGGFLDCVEKLEGMSSTCTAKLSHSVTMEVRKEGYKLVAGKSAEEYSVYVVFRAPGYMAGGSDSRSWYTQYRIYVVESEPLILALTIKELLHRFYEGVWREFCTTSTLVIPQSYPCGRCNRLESWIQKTSASESDVQAPPPDEPVQLSLF